MFSRVFYGDLRGAKNILQGQVFLDILCVRNEIGWMK